jgi:membrane dipeptidase
LTAFGAQVVKECNRLGIVVDLAHASHETVLAALKVTTQPVLVSHTSLDSRTGGNPKMAEMMKPRLISKEHAKVVADAGGVIGVWTHLADSLKDFVGSLRAMVDAVGIDHVGIGTDTDLLSPRVGQGTNAALASVEPKAPSQSKSTLLGHAMAESGWVVATSTATPICV